MKPGAPRPKHCRRPGITSTSVNGGNSVATKTKKQAPILSELTPAPLVGPQTQVEYIRATKSAMLCKEPTKEARQEYRRMLELYPFVSEDYGDLAKHYRSASLN